MRYLPHTEQDVREMLAVVGQPELGALFESIPARFRLTRPLDLPRAASEYEIAVESAAPTMPRRGISRRFDVAFTASATPAATMFTCWRFRLVKFRDRIW